MPPPYPPASYPSRLHRDKASILNIDGFPSRTPALSFLMISTSLTTPSEPVHFLRFAIRALLTLWRCWILFGREGEESCLVAVKEKRLRNRKGRVGRTCPSNVRSVSSCLKRLVESCRLRRRLPILVVPRALEPGFEHRTAEKRRGGHNEGERNERSQQSHR